MEVSRWLVSFSGATSMILMIVTAALFILLSVSLSESKSGAYVAAILSAVLGLISCSLVVTMMVQQLLPHRRGPGRILILSAAIAGAITTTIMVALLGWTIAHLDSMPFPMNTSSTRTLVYSTIVLWAVTLCAWCLFLIASWNVRHQLENQAQSLHTDEEPHISSEMQERSPPRTPGEARRYESYDSPPSTATSGRRRTDSDSTKSFRLSLTHIVRPISSKSRLVTQKMTYRAPSIDSGTGEREIALEDAFDSWDIDPDVRAFPFTTQPPPPTSSSSANSLHPSGNGRILETIPASPTASRSPSPGFPLGLEPPRPLDRTRSHSPTTSARSISRRSRATSPSSSHDNTGHAHEAHIHPLFRTDSPEPPPSTTRGTVVTAAPGAGQLIADRQSIRRMRSGSLPTSPSPLGNSDSMEDRSIEVRTSVADSDTSNISTIKEEVEREMTPPIPEWILGAGTRASLTGYVRRKGAAAESLMKVNEQ